MRKNYSYLASVLSLAALVSCAPKDQPTDSISQRVSEVHEETSLVKEVSTTRIHITYEDGEKQVWYQGSGGVSIPYTPIWEESLEYCLEHETRWRPCDPF